MSDLEEQDDVDPGDEEWESGEPVLVGIDFTADRLRIALAGLDGGLLLTEEHDLPRLAEEAAWSWEIGGRIATAFARDGEQRWALGIGIACPGAVDPVAGRMVTSHAQPEWAGLSVVEALRRHIDAPIVALNRAQAALRGEHAQGAAGPVYDSLYVTLRDQPQAAIMVSGRIAGGGGGRAGGLPALPSMDPAAPLDGPLAQTITSVLADAAALLDPALVVVDGEDHHVDPLLPVLQGVLAEIAPGVRVARAALGVRAALLGALQTASVVAFEGERTE